MSAFTHPITVLFQHCDPAGIVFYPRYFEMVNATVEAWYASLGHSFARMHVAEKRGVPLAAISAEFHAPSRLGDALTFALTLSRLGTTSATGTIEARCVDEHRMSVTATLVHVDLVTGRPLPWPADLREGMGAVLTATR